MRSLLGSIKTKRLFRIGLLLTFVVLSCAADNDYPENIIVFIGDGMGVAHITGGKIAAGTLNLERFSISGLVTTHSANRLVTDSAAAATALATGTKTNNHAVSVSPDNTPLTNLFEYARQVGKSTGVVVTSAVTGATPAAFMAHADNRRKQAAIAEQIVDSGVDVLIGGGWVYFVPASNRGSRRGDDKNLLAALEKRMPVVLAYDKISAHTDSRRLAALLAPEALPKAADRDYSLAQLVRIAARTLSKNRKGFVLLVEGSQIDWASHDNDAQNLIAEILDFDAAVGAALEFARKQRRTLIVVTADHEAGGFAVHDGSIQNRQLTSSAFTTTGHTAAMVPIFAYGPSSAEFGGILDNARVGQMLIDLLLKREIKY